MKTRITTLISLAALATTALPILAANPTPEQKTYREEEVFYTNTTAGVTLAGTLSLPESRKPCPAILFITGSGPQDRDETIGHLKPFAVLAKAFASQGIAVLRVDDRGTGKSTGNWIETSYAGYCGDVRRGLDYLQSRREIDPQRIGLLGHSEGGVIGSVVAAQSPDVAFLVLIGSPCIPGDEVLLKQNELMLRNCKVSEEDIRSGLAGVKKLVELYRANLPRQELEAKLLAAVKSKKPTPSDQDAQGEVNMLKTAWAKDYFTFDTTPSLKQLRCPILAVWGEKEQNVTAQENSRGLAACVQQSGNRACTIHIFPGMNHLLQHCEKGDPGEFFKYKDCMDPTAVQFMKEWLAKTVLAKAR